MKLLVCIVAHYNPERIQYLEKIIEAINKYDIALMVYVDTNSNELDYITDKYWYIKTVVHKDLQHPFHLTQKHREHFKRELNNYDWFMYLEDDMLVTWENFLSYTKKFDQLWPTAVPSFVRIEEKDGEEYLSDVVKKHSYKPFWFNQRQYISFPFPENYHAFWIAPQHVLRETINESFTKLHDSREKAASYLIWELGKKGLIEVVNGQIKDDCYSYHLPNNYVDSPLPNGKIKVKEVFI